MPVEDKSLSDEELSAFLNQIGVANEHKASEKASLEKLIDSVLEKPVMCGPDSSLHGLEDRPKKSRFPLWLSVGVLGAFFAGTLFGFFWAKNEFKAFGKQDTEILYLLQQIKGMCTEILEETEASAEVLQPFEPPKENQKLAPLAFS